MRTVTGTEGLWQQPSQDENGKDPEASGFVISPFAQLLSETARSVE